MNRIIILMFSINTSCGKNNENLAPSLSGVDQTSLITSSNSETVFGRIKRDDKSPAQMSVILFDHSTLTLRNFPLTKDQSFSIPLEFFLPEKQYSLHLVDRYRWLGTIKFGEAMCGVIKYHGGSGFDVGDLQFPDREITQIEPHESIIQGKIGGGFSLDRCDIGDFDKIVPIRDLTRAEFTSSIVIKNPYDLYHYFLSNRSGVELQRQASNTLSHLNIRLDSSSMNQYSEARLVQYDSLLNNALLLNDKLEVDDNLWKNDRYVINKKNPATFDQRFFSGRIPPKWSFTIVQLVPLEGKSFFLPIVFSEFVTFPGYVSHISVENQPLSNLNFSSPEALNGLTSPLCLGQNFKIALAPPVADSPRPPPLFSQLILKLKYLYLENNVLVPITPLRNHYPASFAEDRNLQDNVDWFPSNQSIVISNLKTNTDKILLPMPDEVFLKDINGKSIMEIRAEIRFTHNKYALESVSIVRIAPHCGRK